MAKIRLETDVSKETYELGVALTNMMKGIKEALDDGWQMGEDLPKIITVIVSNLAQAVEGVKYAPSEFKEDPEATVLALALSLSKVLSILKEEK